MRITSKLVLIILLVTVFIIEPASAYKKIKVFMPETPEVDLQGVTKIAVLDFKPSNRFANQAGKILADRMIEFFLDDQRGIRSISGGFMRASKDGVSLIEGIGTKCYSVVERSRLEAVLEEQEMSDIGFVTDADAAQIGQLLGVEVMIYGDISTDSKDKRTTETKRINKKNVLVNCYNREMLVQASIRFVDTKTGEILATRRSSKKVSDKQYGSNKNLADASLMAEQCVNHIAWEFVNMINPWFEFSSFELEKIKIKEFKDKADIAAKAAENLELDKAYAIYNELYELDSYNPKFLYNMGVLYEVTGNFEEAQEMYAGAAMLKDEKRYKKAVERIERRLILLPYFANFEMAIMPFDFETAAADESLFAEYVEVSGKSSERLSIYVSPSKTSDVIARVPGEVQLQVISKENNWYLVKLLGGKQGYISVGDTKN